MAAYYDWSSNTRGLAVWDVTYPLHQMFSWKIYEQIENGFRDGI
jgi:hypothetical protein